MKIAVVDIDQILWPMAEPWQKEIHKINPLCPFPGDSTWDFYKGYLTEEELNLSVKNVHSNQHMYTPFNKADLLIKTLRDHGFYIKIASHRDSDTRLSTEFWLLDNNIYYDELYTVDDKHFLLEDATIFIDDSPHSQKYALEKNVSTFSIRYHYNKHMEGVIFVEDFEELLDSVTSWCSQYVIEEPSKDITVTISEDTYKELLRKATLLDTIFKEGPEYLKDFMRCSAC